MASPSRVPGFLILCSRLWLKTARHFANMRLHLVLSVSSIFYVLALRPYQSDLDLVPGQDKADVKKLPSDIIDSVGEDPFGWVHISSGAAMLACSALALLWPDSLSWFKAKAAEEEHELSSDDDETENPQGHEIMVNEGSERWFSKALKDTQVVGYCGGLLLCFSNDSLEKVWTQDSLPKNMQRGAALMAGMAAGLFAQRMCFFVEYFTCTGLGDNIPWHEDIIFSVCMVVIIAAAMWLAWTAVPPRQDLSMGHVSSYWSLMLLLWFAFIATSSPPLKLSCGQLQKLSPIDGCADLFKAQAEKLDCSLQGHTACQIFMLFLLSLPFALPQLYHQYLAILWLLLYLGATAWYENTYGLADFNHRSDIPLHCCLLLLSLIVGFSRKFYLEKSMRRQFVSELQQRQAMVPLYAMFKEMVPEYVIRRMLNQETIADECAKVTVLFVLIDSFNEYTRQMAGPSQLLQFLNEYFGKMDDICRKHEVTKIETVAEEYVACVGVSEADRSEEDHSVLLNRLIKAAADILALQNMEVEGHKVKFKMGMHTGTIVAGVIGEKLPRFRLFGDTINTSARMMQKGAPGTVQFGKETKEYVSDDQVVDNSTRPNNGIVTMKGKGDVQTWVLKTREGAQPAEDTSGGKRQSVLQMITGATVEVDQDDKFDSIMDEQLAEDETEFSAKEEAQWFSWWHHKNCKTFGVRMSFLTFLFSAVTLAEILHMEHIRAWREDDNKDLLKVRGYFRVRLYLFFRFVAFAILIVWSVVANSKLQWLRREGRSVQVVLVGSKVLISLLVWLSYNVLVLEKNDVPYQNLNPLEYVNQQFSLVFMVAFFVIINGQVLTFYASLVFIPLAFFFMALEDKTPLYVSFTGRVVFLGVACLSCVLAEEGERSSRARFRSKAKVRKTQARIENVLKTLMPAQVLRELRANPGKLPSHEYKHATIAQSDLCGFTQLSSGRKPQEVVGFMGELFGRFDVLANEFGIYKVETVGDAYIAGMAETCLTETNSALRVVEFGLAMIKATAKWSQRLRAKGDDYKDANIRCRVGVHHGECVGGIVGTGMMRYHLFGEFMSIVDILEATSKEGICQISDACKKQIELEGGASNSIKFEEREDELKTSKGEVHSRDEVGGKTFLVYPAITEDRVRDLEEGLSELTKKVNDLEMRTSGHQDE